MLIDVPDSLVDRTKRAVAVRNCNNSRGFVRTAIENHLQLGEETSQESKTLEGALNLVKSESEIEASLEGTQTDYSGPEQGREQQSDDIASVDCTDETTLSLAQRQCDDVPMVALPGESWLDKHLLWGQYNRIFPIKMAVRGLTSASLDSSDERRPDDSWLTIQPFRRRAARMAREVGTEIATHDERTRHKRGKKLAAASTTGGDLNKSMARSGTHLAGHVECDTELIGSLPHLLFVDIVQESLQRVKLTDSGQEFATLSNPRLDGGIDADKPLSQREREFCTSHRRDIRQKEYAAIQTITQAIEEGHNRPPSPTEWIGHLSPEWSNSRAETVRAGLTGRVYGLRLADQGEIGHRGIDCQPTVAGETLRANDTESTQAQ